MASSTHTTATVYPSLVVVVPPTGKVASGAVAGSKSGWSIFDPVKNWLYGGSSSITTSISIAPYATATATSIDKAAISSSVSARVSSASAALSSLKLPFPVQL